ncbi:Ccdc38 [Symbiodinium necroappetens]|uniref:Ccdc38 protein n=1 Tax=Symbiodinium necroappetens TaxID=1628268 RepID=A0A812SLN0_9DINO|nr:Ccdc38 [Symbiodinium necroappetens]
MKLLADQGAASFDKVAECYSGPEQSVWELVMGKQIDIGGASSTMEVAEKAGVGPGMKGVDLNCNNGGGMRCPGSPLRRGPDGGRRPDEVRGGDRPCPHERGRPRREDQLHPRELLGERPSGCLGGLRLQQGCLVLHAQQAAHRGSGCAHPEAGRQDLLHRLDGG